MCTVPRWCVQGLIVPTARSAVRLAVVRCSVGLCVPSRSHTLLCFCASVCIFAVLACGVGYRGMWWRSRIQFWEVWSSYETDMLGVWRVCMYIFPLLLFFGMTDKGDLNQISDFILLEITRYQCGNAVKAYPLILEHWDKKRLQI